jgi:hypothetical protein
MLEQASSASIMGRAALPLICLGAFAQLANAQGVPTFAGNAQHTAIYQPAARNLNRVLWSTTIDLNPGAFAHYGAPLITASNTVIAPVKTAANGFRLDVFNGSGGAAKYSLAIDYILPSSTWIPVYQPVLATVTTGLRLYYAGAGGTVYFIDNPDSNSPGVPTRRAFYGLTNYQANISGFNSTVFINTPITADANGNIFFGFRVQGTAPAPLNTTQSGFARIDPNGNATYVLAGAAAADSSIQRDSHNSAPALSNDGSTLYVVVKSASTEYYGFLLGLDAVTLATKYKVFLKDPRNGNSNNAGILDVSTASPTVAPDGDVYFGIFSNPDNGSRGFLLRFSGDLSVEKTSGGFGWDYTAAIVPASMSPLYTGTSSYLIFAKYNNYVAGDGNGVNRIALLDPNATQTDPHSSANGLIEMREVLTVAGPTPDAENPTVPNAVREWCIATAAINPATNSIFTPSEDGHIYRWNLATNSLSQAVVLSPGVGEPYVPSVIGPDGTVYTLNGGTMFALGDLVGDAVTLSSTIPDVRSMVSGQTVTFNATVANTGGSGLVPTGTVTFQDRIYFISGSGTGSTNSVLGTVPLDGSGNAAFTTSGLNKNEHFISAVYNGDGNFGAGSVTLVENVHGSASGTSLTPSPNPSAPGQAVTFTATVTAVPPGSTTPTGMVTFQDGATVLAQLALGTAGTASFNTSSLSPGNHTITAVYASDSVFAASTGNATQVVQTGGGSTTTSVTSSPNPSVFGQAVTFTALVSSGTGVPTGTVAFLEGAFVFASGVSLDGAGGASFMTSSLAAGPHVITANFTGTNGWSNSSGNDSGAPQAVNKSGTTVQLTSSSATAVFSQPVTFTARVTANAPGGGVPSGTVTFNDGTTVLGTGSLDSTGRAVLTRSGLAVGSHSISASYGGDSNFNGSSSAVLSQTVNQDSTRTTLVSSADPAKVGQAVTFTATVSAGAPGTGTPSGPGSVTFLDKNTALASVALDDTGHASYTTSTLSQGTHQITARYGGTPSYASSTSSNLVENVKK